MNDSLAPKKQRKQRDLAAEALRKFPIGSTVLFVGKYHTNDVGVVVGYGQIPGEVIYKNRLIGKYAGNSTLYILSPKWRIKQ